MSKFRSHVRADKIKWIATGAAVFIICLTIVGFGLQLWGKGKQKPSEWFKKSEPAQSETVPEEETPSIAPKA